jgi:PEP-CTERM motif-containing protein
MRMRLLLIFLLAIAAMGADCGGGGSSNANAPASSSNSVTFAEIDTQGDDSAPPVPEPSALLVFGAGLLIAGVATRRSR